MTESAIPTNDRQDGESLYLLGRRMERLFLLGILLILLIFFQMYVTTAARQISQDRSIAAVTGFLDRLTSDEPRLTALYQSSKAPTSPSAAAPKPSLPTPSATEPLSERARLAAQTRKQLGLPEPKPPREPPQLPSTSPSTGQAGSPTVRPAPVTYAQALGNIFSDVTAATRVPPEEIARLNDPARAPSDLINTLQQQKRSQESKPASVWGIETPRLLQVQYAGLDYKIPLGPLAITMAVAFLPLIAGWLGAIYMTRQRELMRIFKLGDYKLAFPHILNVLPVRFHRIERLLKTTPKRPALTAIANETLCAVIRSIVLVLFLVPMLSAYGNSLYELWQMNDEQVTAPFLIAAAVLFALALVALVLVLHEWIALHGKQFDE